MTRTDLETLDVMTDTDIDYSEIPELPDDFADAAEWFSEAEKSRGGRQNEED